MQLTKHHGLGNDFLVALVDDAPDEGPDLARRWCHRTEGIGADGLIFAVPGAAAGADVAMTLYNSDGSPAEISGNGIRCLAQAWFARHGGTELRVATGAGVRRVELGGVDGHTAHISVGMGAIAAGPPLVPLGQLARPGYATLRAETGDIGNPHLVVEVDDLAGVDPALDGPALEAHWKPEGINVHFLSRTGDDAVTLVHWERGAGVTAACGSGAAVAATIANRWGLVGERVDVLMPGGRAQVRVGGEVTLTGPAVHVARIEVTDD